MDCAFTVAGLDLLTPPYNVGAPLPDDFDAIEFCGVQVGAETKKWTCPVFVDTQLRDFTLGTRVPHPWVAPRSSILAPLTRPSFETVDSCSAFHILSYSEGLT